MTANRSTRPPRDAPLYQAVKESVLEGILQGALAPGHRVPSEQELVDRFGVSRMTANRALRELMAEGYLVRVQGAGTFVAEPKPETGLLELRNIAEEIRGRGHEHACEVLVHESAATERRVADLLGLKTRARVFHSVCLHRENGLPVQLEDRWVNPAAAPAYLDADLTRTTATEVLVAAVHADEIEHTVEAVLPDAEQRRLLAIGAHEPCLSVRRRTWSGPTVVTVADLLYPGSRYRLQGRAPGR